MKRSELDGEALDSVRRWESVYADGWEYETVLMAAVASYSTEFHSGDGSGCQVYGIGRRTFWE